MPIPQPELVQIQHSIAEYFLVGGGFATLSASAYLGMRLLGQKFESFKEQNDKDHKEIKEAIDKQNSQIDTNTTDISRMKGVCHERHKHDGPVLAPDRSS